MRPHWRAARIAIASVARLPEHSIAASTLIAFTQTKNLIDNPDAVTGVKVVTVPDLRWQRRDIKSVMLLAPVLGKQEAYEKGGFEGWKAAKLPLVPAEKLPPRDAQGRTVWVTRARPKIDRIACPWLIRRFIDPNAVFLYVTPSEVMAVGERTRPAYGLRPTGRPISALLKALGVYAEGVSSHSPGSRSAPWETASPSPDLPRRGCTR